MAKILQYPLFKRERKMSRINLLLGCTALVCVSVAATAAPVLNYTCASIGDGLYGYTFYIDNNDGLLLSDAVVLGFSEAHQVGAFGGVVAVDKEDDANLYDPMAAADYDQASDSWVFNPFAWNTLPLPGRNPLTGTPIVGGFLEEAGGYAISLGSGPHTYLGNGVPVVYIVADIDGGIFEGVIGRDGKSYDVSGVYTTPAAIGDYNADGRVDLADHAVWLDSLGQTGSDLPADGNGDGVVDMEDYMIWADHFVSPAITSDSVPAAGDYKPGDALVFTITWDKAVMVVGEPRLEITIGDVATFAAYTSGSATDTLTFIYTILSGDDGELLVTDTIDLNGGTIKDADDKDAALVASFASTSGVNIKQTYSVGDYNVDGVVDLADYTVWADHFGQTGVNLPGDGNKDGTVDLSDYTVWADHYGEMSR